MRIGDLVRCTFQPSVSRVENDCAMPMKHHIKGEIGIITEIRDGHEFRQYNVLFTHLGYTHSLSDSGFELVSRELSDDDLEKVQGGMSEKSFDNWRCRMINEGW